LTAKESAMSMLNDPEDPETLPEEIVRWQPNHRPLVEARAGTVAAGSATGSALVGALALGAMALGALAIGALAIGSLGIGRLRVRRATLGRVEIDDLVVHRLKLPERH
jgi:hypothetical protein